jgi:hypothetical protein
MKENFTRIAVILDRSGSMSSVRESTVSGFNEFIRSQRALPGDVSVKLVQFDDQYEVVFDKRLADVPELTQDLFVPRGRTALFDAQGRTIVALGEELAALAESERPSKVIVMTLTDGLENASSHFTVEMISALIKQQIEVYKWDFVFLGANQDAIRTAATMSIPAGSALTFLATTGSSRRVFQAASDYVSAGRSMRAAQPMFSKETRAAVMAEDDDKPKQPKVTPAPPAPAVP